MPRAPHGREDNPDERIPRDTGWPISDEGERDRPNKECGRNGIQPGSALTLGSAREHSGVGIGKSASGTSDRASKRYGTKARAFVLPCRVPLKERTNRCSFYVVRLRRIQPSAAKPEPIKRRVVGSGTTAKLTFPEPSIRPDVKFSVLNPWRLVFTPLKSAN